MKNPFTKKESKGGFKKFVPLTPQETCKHPEHLPPSYMVYRPGYFEYECPSCGHTTKFTVRQTYSLYPLLSFKQTILG